MGIILLVIGLAVLGFGFWNHLQGKRILSAPFKTTGDLAKNPVSEDPKGAMSTEGAVQAPSKQLLSPCSKTPCLYYEVKIERLWEKTETTQDGTKTTKGATTLDTVKNGATFALDDGSGAIEVDFSKGGDFDMMKDGFKKELNGRSWSSNIKFGEMTYDVPPISSSDGYTIGFKATEKYVPVEGNLFVLGRIEGSKLVKPGWRTMMASNKGRDGLLANVAKKKKFSFIGGGVAAVASIPAMIFAPKSDPQTSAYCSSMTDARAKCTANVKSVSGDAHPWTVTKAGRYQLEVFAPKKKIGFAPGIKVEGADGKVLANGTAGVAGNAVTDVDVQPGTYSVVVYPSDGYMVAKGGFDYEMEIRSAGPAGAAPSAAVDPGLPAGADDGVKDKTAVAAAKEEAAPAAAAPAKGKTSKPVKKKGKK
ncbi:MAG: hypothetical protein IPJ65_12740 [Archangiaceae bacterium]|nr:hypothetical protein [Archangiaceae bacterium]